jgi:glycosyltransferase involved in cell wall biosynthesis
VHFAEPFGLAVVEAMACGTPVIATRRGSMPEVIDDGITGYLVHTVAEAIGVVPAAAELDRRIVRATAERRFSVDRMVEDYLAVYRGVLSR